jgi:small subunit ribosomal protein S8
MNRMNPLANAFSTMLNNEFRNKRECIIAPASRLIGDVLRVLQMNGYIGKFEFIDDGRMGKFDVQLFGRINRCGAIRPRYSCKNAEIEQWEERYLPSKGLGVLILSTSKGIVSHREAKESQVGGKLLAYVY